LLPPKSEQESVSIFCDRREHADPALAAERVYGSRQRTSSKNGILKAEAVVRFARILESHGIEYLQDVSRIANYGPIENEIRTIPGQRSGISLKYFLMLAGSEEFIKPDRMVLRFLKSALSRDVVVQDASPLLRTACQSLNTKYPQLTPRLLDNEIWKYQRPKSMSRSGCGGLRRGPG
jgi:hypothetical protein